MHIPVLLKEMIEMLNIRANGTYIDATVGLGGHSEKLLSILGAQGRLVGIDRDDSALEHASERLGNHRVILRKGAFSQMKEILLGLNIEEVDGVLFDLGVSSLQLKELGRGFSFLSNAKLDMRMDTAQQLTAWDVVNTYSEMDIGRILKEYGEDPFARKIARAIVAKRKKSPISTCAELAEIVIGVCGRRGKTHPATRTFQALRIEVNRELDELKEGLRSALNILNMGGRLCVISYHSLEDRIVKNFMRDSAKEGHLRLLTKKPVTPLRDEIRRNPSSRSAKLRTGERL